MTPLPVGGLPRLLVLLAALPLARGAPDSVADLVPATATLGALTFTGSSCRHVASGVVLSGYPAGGGDRVLPAARLARRGAEDACADGELVFSGAAAPAALLSGDGLTAYQLFLRVVERDWPAELRDFSGGRVSGCPAAAGAADGEGARPPANVSITSVFLFTPPDADSAVSAADEGEGEEEEDAAGLFRAFGLAEDVLYAAVEFDLSDASAEELAGFPCGDRCVWKAPEVRKDAGGRLTFHCFYAEDVAAADAAALRAEAADDAAEDAAEDEVPELPGADDPLFRENRRISVGEGIGIACGFLLSVALLAGFFLRRRRLNREEEADLNMLPTLG